MHLHGLRKDDNLIQDIRTYFLEKGYRSISVNIENINIYYLNKEQGVNVAVLLHMSTGSEFTKDQYQNILRQIYSRFNNGMYQSIHLISLIATPEINKVRLFCEEGMDTWIIDLNYRRIIRYENQVNDFSTLYKELERVISKDIFNSNNTDSRNTSSYTTDPNRGGKSFDSNYQGYQGFESNHEWEKSRNHPLRRNKKLPFEITTLILIAINVVIFLSMDLFHLEDKVYTYGALYWPSIEYANEYYRLLTSMFIHGSMDHLFNNMLVLLFIGDTLERTVGKIKYLIIYFASGIIAGFVSMSYNMGKGALVQSVGASGAIFGVVGAVAFLVIVNKGRLKDISTRQIFIFVALSLYGGLSSQGIDNAAHIGGLIAGVLISAVLYLFQKKRGII